MYVLAIDPGFKNFALCLCEIDEDGEIEAIDFQLIDLVNLQCGSECKLPHSSHVVHKIAHVFEMYNNFFARADKIFIEKQPLLVGSMLHVEALLYERLQDRAELVPPEVMHRHFGLKKGDYEHRKSMVVDLAGPHLVHLAGYRELERKHDVGDAYLLCRLYADRVRAARAKARKVQKIAVDLERFKFVRPA